MALIHCPECQRDVSDRASQCPHCGCPIEVESKQQSMESNVAASIDDQELSRARERIRGLTDRDLGAMAEEGSGQWSPEAWIAIQEEGARRDRVRTRRGLRDVKTDSGAAEPSTTGSPTFRVVGALLFILGAAGVVYFLQFFDTSVPAFGGTRVNNLGLMQDKQNGLMLGALAAVVGLALLLYGQHRGSKRS